MASSCCEECGLAFMRKRRRRHGKLDPMRFCSRACSFAHLARRKEQHAAELLSKRLARPCRACRHCGVTLLNRKKRTCCGSVACVRAQYRLEHLKYHTPAVDVVVACMCCGQAMPERGRRCGPPRLWCSGLCRGRMDRYQKYYVGLRNDEKAALADAIRLLKALNRSRNALNKGCSFQEAYGRSNGDQAVLAQ